MPSRDHPAPQSDRRSRTSNLQQAVHLRRCRLPRSTESASRLPSMTSGIPPNSVPRCQSPFARPLFSWSYELLLPQLPCFEKHLRCPPGCGGTSFPTHTIAAKHPGRGCNAAPFVPSLSLRSRYRFRHPSTPLLLRQPFLPATIFRTLRIAFSGAARLSAVRWKLLWQLSIGKNSNASSAVNFSSLLWPPFSSSCWPAAWPYSCTHLSSSIQTPPTNGLLALPSSVSARLLFSSSATCLSASAPSTNSSSKFSKNSSAMSNSACKPAPTFFTPCRTSTISGIALQWNIAAP